MNVEIGPKLSETFYPQADDILNATVKMLQEAQKSSTAHRNFLKENSTVEKAMSDLRKLSKKINKEPGNLIGVNINASKAYRLPDSNKGIVVLKSLLLTRKSLVPLDFLGQKEGDFRLPSLPFDKFRRIDNDWYIHTPWKNIYVPVEDIKEIKAVPTDRGIRGR